MNIDGFNLGVVIPVWKRPEVTRLVLDYYKRLDVSGLTLSFLIVSSPEDPCQHIWQGFEGGRFRILNCENDPVSRKFNQGVLYLSRIKSIDAITVIGSDDLVNKEYLLEACKSIARGCDHVGANGIHFYSIDDDELFYTPVMNCGAGALISKRAVVKNFAGRPFPEGRNQGIDQGFNRRCRQYGVEKFGTISVDANGESGFAIVDIKRLGKNVNGYRSLRDIYKKKVIGIDPAEYFVNMFDTDIHNRFLEVKESA